MRQRRSRTRTIAAVAAAAFTAGAAARALDETLTVLDGLVGTEFTASVPEGLLTYVLVLDGMEPERIGPTLTPRIWALVTGGAATVYARAQGSLASETNTNHVGITTGAPAELSGTVGNSVFNRRTGAVNGTHLPHLLLQPTVFDAVEGQRPELRTAFVGGKQRLRTLFDCTRTPQGACGPNADNPEGVPVEHRGADHVGGANTSPSAVLLDPEHNVPAEPVTGSTTDNAVMDQVLALDAHVVVVNMAEVDVVQHVFGEDSPEALAAVLNADLQIGRLVDKLQAEGKWSRSVVFITADHSFQGLEEPVSNPVTGQVTGERVILSEVLEDEAILRMLPHGGTAGVYLRDPADTEGAARVAAKARALVDASGRPAVAAAYCRLASEGCPGFPPEWGVDTPRMGEVLLVADDQHVFFLFRDELNAAIAGQHGGPSALPVPLIVASGGSFLRPGLVNRPVSTRDIAATLGELYGLEVDGHRWPKLPSWSKPLREAFR